MYDDSADWRLITGLCECLYHSHPIRSAIAGTVESIAPAAGQVFSLLPPENATGNFTKIVQRVPVRVRVPASVLESGRLRPGLSAVVTIDTRSDPKASRTAEVR